MASPDYIETDVLIVGGGMAGATSAAMLGRAGIATLLVDPKERSPPDFRCEKLDETQLALVEQTGLRAALEGALAPSQSLWVARYGRLVDRPPHRQAHGRYEDMVNAMRELVGGSAQRRVGRLASLEGSGEHQEAHLADGTQVRSRLVVLATGLSKLPARLGIARRTLVARHSLSIGFDLVPQGAPRFPFDALTWYPHRSPPGIAYLTLFPFERVMRANLFAYWDTDSPWPAAFRADPDAALDRTMPGLSDTMGPARVQGTVRTRWADLYETTDPVRAGVVLVGDAFSTSCPPAGTGIDKVMTDVTVLCSRHIPTWLASPGMGADKVAAYYADPDKRRCDAWSLERALETRAQATSGALQWRLRRGATFVGQLGRGSVRRAGQALRLRLRSGTPSAT